MQGTVPPMARHRPRTREAAPRLGRSQARAEPTRPAQPRDRTPLSPTMRKRRAPEAAKVLLPPVRPVTMSALVPWVPREPPPPLRRRQATRPRRAAEMRQARGAEKGPRQSRKRRHRQNLPNGLRGRPLDDARHGGSLSPERASRRRKFAAGGSARPSIRPFVRYSDRAAFGSLFLSDGRNGLVRGLCFQKLPNWSWHGPRPHINRVGPIETPHQVPAQIVQVGIEDGADLLPLFAIAKNLAVANYSENLAAVRIDDITLEHGFLFCVSNVPFATPNSPRCSGSVLLSADASEWRAQPRHRRHVAFRHVLDGHSGGD